VDSRSPAVSTANRGELVGAALAGVFGAAWSLWAASGLGATIAVAVRVAGATIGAVIVAASFRARRRAAREPTTRGRMFSSAGYRITVVIEVAALIGGNVVLNATGHQRYIIVWVAAVAGVHFLAFARLFWSGFYWLGGALLAAAGSGALVVVTGGGAHRILAVVGLIAAGSLFVAGGSTILRARPTAPSHQ
jgi:hypothetical protein